MVAKGECIMKISNLSKNFGSKKIFSNQSFELADGKITYIMGESGCGKTTLLRIIAGLDKKFSGNINFGGSKISYVFQEPRLFPNLTVAENISIVSENSPFTVEELLNLVELETEANNLASTLSGGMKMRIALARAIYYNGDIFLMDEPFSALDSDLKSRILPEIFKKIKGKTVIIVSHSQEEANSYADEIIKLN